MDLREHCDTLARGLKLMYEPPRIVPLFRCAKRLAIRELKN